MKLLRLRLENFRQHADTDLTFHGGMTAIVGPNGSGKSTIVEAIGFALYGEQRDKKETVRFQWGKGKRFAVTLEFEFDGRRFQVERTHSDAHLTQLGDKEVVRAHGLTETTRASERLLHLGYEQFVNSFCAEQKQLAFLQFRTNAVRQEEVARMLGFDRLRLAEDLAGQRRRETAMRREALDRTRVPLDELTARQQEAKESLRRSKRELKAAEKGRSQLEAELARAAAKREEAEQWLGLTRDLAAREGEIAGLRRVREAAVTARERARQEVEEHRRLSLTAAAYQEADGKLRELLPLQVAAATAEGLRQEIDEVCVRMASVPEFDPAPLLASQADLEGSVRSLTSEWEAERERLATEVGAALARVESARQALARAEASAETGICPECGQPVADAPDRLDRAGRDLRDAEERLLQEQDQQRESLSKPEALRRVEEELAQVSGQVREAREAALQRARLVAQRLELEGRLRALPETVGVTEIDRWKRQAEETRAAHQRWLTLGSAPEGLADREAEASQAEASLSAAEEKRDVLEATRARLSFESPEAATEAVGHHQAVSEALAKVSAERTHAEELLRIAERDLASIETRIAEQRALEAEVSTLRAQEVLFETGAREMRTLRQELNTSIGPELASRGSENLSLLTNGRYLALELDKQFSASIVEDGVAKPVISGGEEDVVALSLRLALSELIQERQGRPMTLLILDEVFASLDIERRQAVLDRLTALKGRFEQILVITHIEEVQQVADQTIHLRRDAATRATVIVEA